MVIAELRKIGFANMADYMKVGSEGYPTLNFSELTRDQAAALVEVTIDEFVDDRNEDARKLEISARRWSSSGAISTSSNRTASS